MLEKTPYTRKITGYKKKSTRANSRPGSGDPDGGGSGADELGGGINVGSGGGGGEEGGPGHPAGGKGQARAGGQASEGRHTGSLQLEKNYLSFLGMYKHQTRATGAV